MNHPSIYPAWMSVERAASLRDSEKKEKKNDLPGPDAQVWIYTEPGVERKLATVVDPKMIDSRILHSITIPPNALFTARFNKEDATEERRLREWPDDSQWSPDEFVSVLNDKNWQSYYTEPKSCKEVWGEMSVPMSELGRRVSPAKKVKVVDLKDIIQIEVNKQLNDNIQLKKFNAQNELIEKQKKEIEELKELMIMERKCMQFEIYDAEQEIEDLKKERRCMQNKIDYVEQENKEMTGSLVKAQWVIEKIKDVEGFTDTGAAIAESFEYIDFPETEKEEFVATSYTDSVVETSTIREDREYYGEDFYEEAPIDTNSAEDIPTVPDEENFSTVQPLTPRRSLRINLSELFDRVETGRREQRWVQRFNVVDRYEDTTVFPDGPELPWYEARYPTPSEIEAAQTIQRAYRTVRGAPNNDTDISPWPREMEYVDAIRQFLYPELNCEGRYL